MNRRLLSVVTGGALLALAAPAHADLTELKWASEGYFRTRTVTLTNLAPQPRVVTTYPGNGEQLIIPDIRSSSYIVSRLRIMPSLQFGKQVRMNFQIDALDDVLWGDNNGLSTAPLFATDGDTEVAGGVKPNVATSALLMDGGGVDKVAQFVKKTNNELDIEETAAGPLGGGEDGGHTFIRLSRIAEAVDPQSFTFSGVTTPPPLPFTGFIPLFPVTATTTTPATSSISGITSPTVAEGGNLDFVVTLNNNVGGVVNLLASNGTAMLGSDVSSNGFYSFDGGGTWMPLSMPGGVASVPVPAGVSSFTMRMPSVDDSTVESAEDYTLRANLDGETASLTGTGDFINTLAIQAGIPADNEDLKNVLSAIGGSTVSVPDTLTKEINRGLLTIDAARNNDTLKDHFYALFANGGEAHLKRVTEELGWDAQTTEQVMAEKTLMAKYSKLVEKVRATHDAGKKPAKEVEEQIAQLNADLLAAREAAKTAVEQERTA